jgi:hypothetical protein
MVDHVRLENVYDLRQVEVFRGVFHSKASVHYLEADPFKLYDN